MISSGGLQHSQPQGRGAGGRRVPGEGDEILEVPGSGQRKDCDGELNLAGVFSNWFTFRPQFIGELFMILGHCGDRAPFFPLS